MHGCVYREKPAAVAGAQAADDLFKQHYAERVAEFANLEFEHAGARAVLTSVIT